MEMSVLFGIVVSEQPLIFIANLMSMRAPETHVPKIRHVLTKVNGFICHDYTTFVLVDLRVFGKYIHVIYLIIASFVK